MTLCVLDRVWGMSRRSISFADLLFGEVLAANIAATAQYLTADPLLQWSDTLNQLISESSAQQPLDERVPAPSAHAVQAERPANTSALVQYQSTDSLLQSADMSNRLIPESTAQQPPDERAPAPSAHAIRAERPALMPTTQSEPPSMSPHITGNAQPPSANNKPAARIPELDLRSRGMIPLALSVGDQPHIPGRISPPPTKASSPHHNEQAPQSAQPHPLLRALTLRRSADSVPVQKSGGGTTPQAWDVKSRIVPDGNLPDQQATLVQPGHSSAAVPSSAIPFQGMRMASSLADLTAVLNANLAQTLLTTAYSGNAAPPRHDGESVANGSEPSADRQLESSLMHIAQFANDDLEQLLDQLADRLEFDLIRTYGTSGR